MKTFTDFITEANDLDARNQAVDIQKIVREKAKIYNESYNANIKEDVIASIIDYMSKTKLFSVNKILENFNVPGGFAKSIVDAVKKALTDSGFGKAGNASVNQTKAERINSFLKQKHIGPIKR